MGISPMMAMAIGMGVSAAATSAQAGWQMAHQPDIPEVKPPDVTSDKANENEAQKEREKRRRSYAGMGRSSTILTQNLGSIGQQDDRPKQLLGV